MSTNPGTPDAGTTRNTRRQQRRTRPSRLSDGGFTLLGPVLVLAVTFCGAGLIKVRRAIEHRTERQVLLDRNTGEAALLLRAALITLQASYQRLDRYRVITLSLCPATPSCPTALQAFKIAAMTERLIEESVRLKWNEQRLKFMSDYPDFNFQTAAGDTTDLTIKWTAQFEARVNPEYRLDGWDGNLISQSTVGRVGHGWSVAWTR
ncbi:MAG: hypothetical protein JST80_09050 [Bdellovibrionales bacterium]|nr:hypothetical protein [Bdellovibrionales bacterium]